MEHLEEKIQELEAKIDDMQISLCAHKMMIRAIIESIGVLHGIEAKNEFSDGVRSGVEDNKFEDGSIEAKSHEILAEKLKPFIQ